MTERIEPAFEGCGVGTFETVFLRPAQALEAHTEYQLQVGLDLRFFASFTTGEGSFRPEPRGDGDLELIYLRVDRNAFIFWPENEDVGTSWQVSVALPAGEPCIDVRVYGIEGVPLFEEQRCRPDRCAVHALSGGGTCGGPLVSSVDATRIGDSSCEDPPVLTTRPGVGIVYPDDANESHGGCSIGGLRDDASSPCIVGLTALLPLVRLRRSPRGPATASFRMPYGR